MKITKKINNSPKSGPKEKKKKVLESLKLGLFSCGIRKYINSCFPNIAEGFFKLCNSAGVRGKGVASVWMMMKVLRRKKKRVLEVCLDVMLW